MPRDESFQEKKEDEKKKNESPIRSPHDAHSTWFADRLPFVVVVVLGGEEVVEALTLPPKLVGEEASFIFTHVRCVITFLFLRFFLFWSNIFLTNLISRLLSSFPTLFF